MTAPTLDRCPCCGSCTRCGCPPVVVHAGCKVDHAATCALCDGDGCRACHFDGRVLFDCAEWDAHCGEEPGHVAPTVELWDEARVVLPRDAGAWVA